MKNTPAWKILENRVRTVSQYIWNAPAEPLERHGVRLDAVLKLDVDRWIVLEITTSSTLVKLRNDLSKFSTIRPALLADGIHATCYFITDSEPTNSIVNAAAANRVKALSVDQLEKTVYRLSGLSIRSSLQTVWLRGRSFVGRKRQLTIRPC